MNDAYSRIHDTFFVRNVNDHGSSYCMNERCLFGRTSVHTYREQSHAPIISETKRSVTGIAQRPSAGPNFESKVVSELVDVDSFVVPERPSMKEG